MASAVAPGLSLSGIVPVSGATPFPSRAGAPSGSPATRPGTGSAADGQDPAGTAAREVAGREANAGELPADATPPVEPGNEDPGAGFSFGGRTFKTQAEAEQHMTRLEKGHSALRKEQATLQKQLRTAVETAHAWYEHSSSRPEAGEQEPGRRPAEAAAPPAKEKPWLDNVDWEFVRNLADEKGIDYALYYAAQQQDKHFEERLNKRLDEALGPFQSERQQQTALAGQVKQLEQFRDARTESGEVMFPEFQDGVDPAHVKTIVRIWKTLPPEVALDARGTGWEYAILKFRQMQGGAASSMPGAPSGTAVAASRGALRASEQARAAASAVVGGSGTPRPGAEGVPATPREAFRREMLGSPDPFLKTPDGRSLGFTRVA